MTPTEPCLICGNYIEVGKDCPACQVAELLHPDTRDEVRQDMLDTVQTRITKLKREIRTIRALIQEEQQYTFLDQQEQLFTSTQDGRQTGIQKRQAMIDQLQTLQQDIRYAQELHQYREACKKMYQLF